MDIRIQDVLYPAIEVIGYEGNETLLGRDLLNKMWLSLNGPAETSEVWTGKRRRKRG